MTNHRDAGIPLAVILFVFVFRASALEADVRARIAHDGKAWIGQQLMLQVELLTDGQSFRGQHFRIPDIAGALLLEDAVSTTKLSEQRDGVAWQGLRYEFPLFAQRAGSLSIPPIAVEFSVSSGFGGEARDVELVTAPLSLTVNAPAGVTDARQLVTTTAFTVDVNVKPPSSSLKVGDAITRTITRLAADVPGMVFAPLPVREIDGVAAYPKSPEVDDRHNRGELTGRRTEAVTFVFQRAGTFRLPGYELQWWDPSRSRLNHVSVPELVVEVAANPAFSPVPSDAEKVDNLRDFQRTTSALIAFILAVALVYRYRTVLRAQWQRRRKARIASERVRFRVLMKACASDNPARAYHAFQAWQPLVETRHIMAASEPALEPALLQLQQALVRQGSRWNGESLAAATRQARRRIKSTRFKQGTYALAPLNPIAEKTIAGKR